MIKAVCLDVGYTLVDYYPPNHVILGGLLRQFGLDVDEARIHRAYLDALTWYQMRALARDEREPTEDERQRMIDGFERQLLSSIGANGDVGISPAHVRAAFRAKPQRWILFPDSLPVLDALRARGLRLAIVSNWDHSLPALCAELGIAQRVDTIVGSDAVGIEKPDPAIFDVALERLGVRPEEACHVGDIYLADVLGARAAGLAPVLLDRHDLQPEVDCRRVRGLRELLDLVDKLA